MCEKQFCLGLYLPLWATIVRVRIRVGPNNPNRTCANIWVSPPPSPTSFTFESRFYLDDLSGRVHRPRSYPLSTYAPNVFWMENHVLCSCFFIRRRLFCSSLFSICCCCSIPTTLQFIHMAVRVCVLSSVKHKFSNKSKLFLIHPLGMYSKTTT